MFEICLKKLSPSIVLVLQLSVPIVVQMTCPVCSFCRGLPVGLGSCRLLQSSERRGIPDTDATTAALIGDSRDLGHRISTSSKCCRGWRFWLARSKASRRDATESDFSQYLVHADGAHGDK